VSSWTVHVGDVLATLPTLAAGSVRCCVTSPPYWGLRDYGMDGQIGLEPTPDEYIARMVAVFREVRRVLADDGTMWVNMGDGYATQPAGNKTFNHGAIFDGRDMSGHQTSGRKNTVEATGLKPKDLIGMPWLLAFALRADGWYLRSDIIWHKPNPMPESVTDRPTKAHEYVFLLSKQERYFYDAAAIKEDAVKGAGGSNNENKRDRSCGNSNGMGASTLGSIDVEAGRNRRTVWTIPTQPYKEAHFATFPEKLVEPCILAGSAIGDTVLDPFSGSGTTGAVAVRHGRNYVGIELNPKYAEMSRRRIGKEAPLFVSGRTA